MIKNNCELIKLSFEKYINQETNSHTNKLVEKHLLKCKDCQNEFLKLKNNNSILENLKKKNKQKHMVYFIIFFIILLLISLFLVGKYQTFQSIQRESKENTIYSFVKYLNGDYTSKDFNYKNVLSINKNKNGDYEGILSTYNENDILVEQKYFIFNTSNTTNITETYDNLNQSNLSNISNIKLENGILTYDLNTDSSHAFETQYYDTSSKLSDDSLFIIFE